MKMILSIVLMVFTLQVIKGLEETKLLLVQMLYRHGDRTPEKLYKNDPNPPEIWREGLGKLTLLGKQQQYINGQIIRNMYKDFITSNPNEVIAMSDKMDRCLRSAESYLASLYVPTPEWSFNRDVKWQPIPVYYTSNKKDKYLSHRSHCPAADVEEQKINESPEVKQLLADHQEMFAQLSLHSGSIINDTASASSLHDTLFVEKTHNLVIPDWVGPFWNEFTEFTDYSFYLSYSTRKIQRLRTGPLFHKIIRNMEKKLSGDTPDLKVHIFSAHDYNIVGMLTALNVYNMKRPPYCATVLFELHETPDGENAVRLLYLNSTTPENGFQTAHVLVLDGCSEFCPLNDFLDYTKHLILHNWKKECHAT